MRDLDEIMDNAQVNILPKDIDMAYMAVRASNWLGRDVYDARRVCGRWQVRLNPNTYIDEKGEPYYIYEDLSEILKANL